MVIQKIKKLFSVLYKNLTVIMIITAVCIIASVGYSVLYTKPSYAATSKIIIHNGNLLSPSAQYENASAGAYLDTCTEILNSKEIISFYVSSSSLNNSYTVEELSEMIEVTPKGKNSLVFTIKVSAPDPDIAVNLLKEFTNSSISFMNHISSNLFINVLEYDEHAAIDKSGATLLIFGSLFAGLIISCTLILLLNLSNTRVKGVLDYKSRYNIKLLGTVPDFEANLREGK